MSEQEERDAAAARASVERNAPESTGAYLPTQAEPPDLARLKWIDPSDKAKFVRSEPVLSNATDLEALLDNIVRLTDRIFDHLSVFGNFDETTARGAIPRPSPSVGIVHELSRLRTAEQELWHVYGALREKRASFVQEQLQALPPEALRRIHIGSANFVIENWTNIDAGGADIAFNVNWGMPFADDSVEFVYCSHMLEHLRYVDQAPAFLRETWRMLKPGAVARFVVPDIRKLLTAYVTKDRAFFVDRHRFYPLSRDFLDGGVATLDYVLLYSGVGPHTLNYNHKFGYDFGTLAALLRDAGFRETRECGFQASRHAELRIDDCSFDAQAVRSNGEHFSLFVEAVK